MHLNQSWQQRLIGSSRARQGLAMSMLCLCRTFCLGAEPAAPEKEQLNLVPVSLEQVIVKALTNNLDISIERLNPQISFEDIQIAVAGYDPLINFSGQHNYSVSGGGIDQQNRPIPSSKSDSDTFTGGLNGLTPWGMTYNLSGRVNETYGQTGGTTSSNSFLAPFDRANGSAGLTLTQPLLRNLWIDSTRYTIQVNKNLYRITEQRLALQVMNVLTAVEQAYYDLIFARENVKVMQAGLQLAQRLSEEDRRRVEIGKLAPLDEKKSQAEVAARQTDLTTAQRALGTAQNNLKKLITANYRAVHDEIFNPTDPLLAVPFPVDLQDSWTRGMRLRPDLQQARLDLERQGITLKYYRNQMLPQLDVTGSYGFAASGALQEYSDAFGDISRGDKPFYAIGGVFSIPLENKAARSRVKQSKLNVQQALLTLKKLEENALVLIDEAAGQLNAAFKQVESSREARIYAEAALEAEQKKLTAGKSTSYLVLQFQRDLTAARSAEIQALSEYNKDRSQLFLQEGTTLERRGIKVQVK